ncbi:TetR/AcrR family transcriptional regulator [Rhodococcus sp. D2-41]|uniref:TetR/AcrR family transcriptional regulator n=1 Tax=Speluncibacter jeojiensis TaxID=2710754 RepID=UPI002410AA4B|nr:TetR/AcrR family transcriptional regulator [Rhodococcus sp. D2-41]MDG3008837.1 TetR/AcrR family transcriptional regulator [Rhodococcus sp. D2-41]
MAVDRGATLEVRQAARRRDLLAAGIALLGDPAGPAVTVRAVCRRAGLTERYFYESFADRDEFVRSVYDEVGARAQDVLVGAVSRGGHGSRERATAAVEAFVALMVDQPEMGRVLLLTPLTESALNGRGMALMPAFVTLVHDQLSGVPDADEKQMTAIGVVGALSSLFIALLDGTIGAPRERFVAHCVELVAGADTTRG